MKRVLMNVMGSIVLIIMIALLFFTAPRLTDGYDGRGVQQRIADATERIAAAQERQAKALEQIVRSLNNPAENPKER
jgi:uncharacterized membrane protein